MTDNPTTSEAVETPEQPTLKAGAIGFFDALVIGLAAIAVCIIVVVLLNPKTRIRLTRFADFAEWGTIALLLPLAIIAGGWF